MKICVSRNEPNSMYNLFLSSSMISCMIQTKKYKLFFYEYCPHIARNDHPFKSRSVLFLKHSIVCYIHPLTSVWPTFIEKGKGDSKRV